VPADKQPEQVAAADEAQQHKREATQQREEADIACIADHVPLGVHMNDQAHQTDERQHHRRQAIDHDRVGHHA
jgi:hypothetical protein